LVLGSLDRDCCASYRGRRAPRRSVREAVQVGNRSFPDETRYYETPLGHTRDRGGSNGAPGSSENPRGAWARARLAPGASIYGITKREGAAIVAEALLALRSEAKHE